jgi:hypothetical protein
MRRDLVRLAAVLTPPEGFAPISVIVALSPAAIEVADRLRLFEAVDNIGTEGR